MVYFSTSRIDTIFYRRVSFFSRQYVPLYGQIDHRRRQYAAKHFRVSPKLLPRIIEEFRMFVQSDLWKISCPSWKPFRLVQRQSRSRWFDQINPTLLSAINENCKNYRVSKNIVCDFKEEISFKWRHIVV